MSKGKLNSKEDIEVKRMAEEGSRSVVRTPVTPSREYDGIRRQRFQEDLVRSKTGNGQVGLRAEQVGRRHQRRRLRVRRADAVGRNAVVLTIRRHRRANYASAAFLRHALDHVLDALLGVPLPLGHYFRTRHRLLLPHMCP